MRLLRLVCALLLAPGLAHADDDEPEPEEIYPRDGFYIGLGGSYATQLFDKPGGLGSVDGSLGMDNYFGYRFHPNLAAELGHEWLAEFDASGGHLETHAVLVRARAYPLVGVGEPYYRIQPYVILGGGVLLADPGGTFGTGHQTGFALRLGGGLEYYLTEHWVTDLGVGWTKPFGETDRWEYLSFHWGLTHRF